MGTLPNGCVRDENVDYVLKREFVPAQRVIIGQAGTGTNMSTLTTGFIDGGSPYVEINSSNIGGIQLSTTTDAVAFVWGIPYDFDNHHRLLVRHLWCSDDASATAVAASFTTAFTTFSVGQHPFEPSKSNGLYDSSLTVVAPAISATGSLSSETKWTGYGYVAPLNSGSFAHQCFPDGTEGLNMAVNVSTVSGYGIAARNVYWLGMELAWTPAKTFGGGSRREARQMANSLTHLMQAGPDDDV